VGRRQKIRAGDLVGAFVNELGLPGSALGNITLSENQSFVAVERGIAKARLKKMLEFKVKGRAARARLLW
jgi:ATP-independent RNA helicase DbpA